MIEQIRSFGIFAISIFIVSIITIYATQDPLSATTSHAYIYTALILIFFMAGFIFAQYIGNANEPIVNIGASLSMYITTLVVVWLYVYITFYLPRITTATFMKGVLLFMILLNGITIFYNVSVTPITKTSGFLTELFFFIPCMITDAVKYILNDVRTTSATIYFLIFCEILFIGLFLALPAILTAPTLTGRIPVLEGMVFLDRPTIVANSELLHVQGPNPKYWWLGNTIDVNDGPLPTFNKSYSLSFWTFINPNSLIDQTNIFNYGGGKPALSFMNDERSGKFIATFTNINPTAHTFTFPLSLQKWNYFVFTYVDGTCELYVNGTLVHISQLEGDQPTYDPSDTMTLGQDNGLYGSICNVSYYKDPISPSSIVTNYNLLSIQNTPIFTGTPEASETSPQANWLYRILMRNNLQPE